jgi:hypothetical protein
VLACSIVVTREPVILRDHTNHVCSMVTDGVPEGTKAHIDLVRNLIVERTGSSPSSSNIMKVFGTAPLHVFQLHSTFFSETS